MLGNSRVDDSDVIRSLFRFNLKQNKVKVNFTTFFLILTFNFCAASKAALASAGLKNWTKAKFEPLRALAFGITALEHFGNSFLNLSSSIPFIRPLTCSLVGLIGGFIFRLLNFSAPFLDFTPTKSMYSLGSDDSFALASTVFCSSLNSMKQYWMCCDCFFIACRGVRT